MEKKSIIESAIISAKELEETASNNAVNMMVEAFKPRITNLFKEVLQEEETTDHDIGKDEGHDEGKDGDDDYEGNIKEEWEATKPASGREVKNIDGNEWEAAHDGESHDSGFEDIEGEKVANKTSGSMQPTPTSPDPGDSEEIAGVKVANKTGGSSQPDPDPQDPGKFEDELYEVYLYEEDDKEDEDEDEEDDGKEDKNSVPSKNTDTESDDELDVPDELFNDEDEEVEGEDSEDDVNLVSDFEDDNDEDEDSSEDDYSDSEEPDENEMGETEDDEDSDEMYDEGQDEGLYIRKGGEFRKVTLANYLKTRISELSEEKDALQRAMVAMQGQLREANLFNAKLAYVNKLYNSGLFNQNEKETIAERIDECGTIDEVKGTYNVIVKEVKTKNPLDTFSNMIKEARTKSQNNKEKMPLYESPEMIRMRRNAGLIEG